MITFNGKKDEEFGVVFDSFPLIKEGEKRVKEVIIAGRDEPLRVEDGSIGNSMATFSGHVIEKSWEDFLSWISEPGKLIFDDSSKYYRNATFSNISKQNIVDDLIYFTLGVSLSAYSYLISGDTVKKGNSSVNLQNPTSYKSYPLIKIIGSGEIILSLNGKPKLTIKNVKDMVYIDSELDYVYSDTGSMDNLSIGNVPVLNPGDNYITLKGTVSSIEITPRWRTRL
ncbi:hypothetical protein ACKA04_02355 [Helcococcus kunzii]|uniref:hypothetical protein n=1 Tax=Helcococcus kunzii TaxID=40091 RepID=UPI0038AD9D4B